MTAIGTPGASRRKAGELDESAARDHVPAHASEGRDAELISALRERGVFATRLLTRDQCAIVRSALANGRAEDAELLDDECIVDATVRRAVGIEVDTRTLRDVEARLDRCLPALADFFAVALTRREGAAFLRYPTGGFYLPHRDRATAAAWPDASRRRIALVVFLDSAEASHAAGDFSGGALRLLEVGAEVVPRAGWLVAFPAEWLHEVAPVTRGVRHVIVDWAY
jgi:predicted 2-oxoglutarate/Fe(II)-dependent dioxygenase YbiX